MGTDVRPTTPGIDSALMMAGYAAGDIAAEVDDLAAPHLELLVPALAATIARFEAVRLRALHRADQVRVGDRAGMGSTADWVAAVSGEKRGKARGDCELAGKLASMGAIADALADGAVSKTQAKALADADQPTEAEHRELLGAAAGMSVNELERRVVQFNLGRDRTPDPIVRRWSSTRRSVA